MYIAYGGSILYYRHNIDRHSNRARNTINCYIILNLNHKNEKMNLLKNYINPIGEELENA